MRSLQKVGAIFPVFGMEIDKKADKIAIAIGGVDGETRNAAIF